MAKEYVNLLLEVDDNGVALITINRPDKLNALNTEVLNELEMVFTEMNNRDDVRGVILTGAGDKAFVAGADIKELVDLNEPRGRAASERGQEVFSAVENCKKPVIAVVNGYALGGGCELAMACHMRVASEKAIFGLPEVSLGTIPGYGGTQRLTRLIGQGRAIEMVLTGNHIKADLALAFGLVNRMVPHEEALKEAQELLGKILKQGPLAVENAITAIHAADSLPGDEGYRKEAELFGNLCATKDFKEGCSAFLEKRKASFTGN